MKQLLSFALATAISILTLLSANASEYKLGDLVINHPVIPETVKAAPVAAGYLKIVNNGDEDDRLVSVSAEFSAKQEIHTMQMEDGVMRMRPLKFGIVIPAKGEAVLKQGGDHLMFIKLEEQMKKDELRKVSLVFEKAGEITVEMKVVNRSELKSDDNHNHSGHSEHTH